MIAAGLLWLEGHQSVFLTNLQVDVEEYAVRAYKFQNWPRWPGSEYPAVAAGLFLPGAVPCGLAA